MAIMVPDRLTERNTDRERITAGERRVFALLQKLPDDCIVYYEPVVRHRHPDFIVILPQNGVLVIEVKGWWHAELQKVSPTKISLNRRGRETEEKHPGEQAFDYMCRVMNKCREHPQARCLLQAEGAYKNRLAFPFGHTSILTNINRAQLEKGPREIADIFPAVKTATKDQLGEWEALGADELAAKLKTYFDPWWPFPKLTPHQVDILRSVIHPEIVLRQTETDLAVLDPRQENNARNIGNGHRVLYGVAGSGKTVLLIARAKLLAEDPQRRVLLLCYNKLLACYLATAVQGHSNITALNFHKWGGRNGAEFRNRENDDVYGERMRGLLEQGSRDRARFDAVLIDECQDWPCSWFHCAKLALKEPDTGDLLIVGDGSQSLHRARKFTWADAGINAQGRTINTRFDLDRNYRNTVEILRAAQPFSAQPKRGGQSSESMGVLALPVDPDKAIRNGPEPVIVELRNAADEAHYAAALIETWLRGGIEMLGRREPVAAREICILYPRERGVREAPMQLLCERLSSFTPFAWLSSRLQSATLKDDGVRIATIKGSRGLQFRIVVLIWADLLPYDEQMDERSELYVAMTRAEDVLVILHSGRSVYTDELRAAIVRQ
jgi:hypothetical protein